MTSFGHRAPGFIAEGTERAGIVCFGGVLTYEHSGIEEVKGISSNLLISFPALLQGPSEPSSVPARNGRGFCYSKVMSV